MKKSKIFYDKQSDIIYMVLKKGQEAYFEEIEPNVIVEYNKKKEPIGIEILNASSVFKKMIGQMSLVYEKNQAYKTSSK